MEIHNSCYREVKNMPETHIDKAIKNTLPKSSEAVNHPAHYQGKNECIDVMRAMFGDYDVAAFCKCNAFKYRFRAKMKNGDEDIKKAEWYEDYLIKMIEENKI